MSYIVPIHRPSSARHAIKLNFLEAGEETVVVAKANRLEIYSQTTDGLALLHCKSVYGYITMLERLRPASNSPRQTDHLFVGTDRYQYFTCSWDACTKQLKTEQSYVDQSDKVLRDSREMDRCHIDPTRRFMTLELYDGIVTVVPLGPQGNGKGQGKRVKRAVNIEDGSLGEPVQVRIEELQTRSSTFLQTDTDGSQHPRLAILWEDNSDVPQLKLRELKYFPGGAGDQASVEFETVAELREELDLGVSHLLPVPSPYGGLLILGERSISYVDSGLQSVVRRSLQENATIWTCWEQVDEKRWLLADDYGRLYFLMITDDGNGHVDGWRLDHIGTTSKASCLIYLDAGLCFVGSHSGDSQVIRIMEGGLEIVQNFANIAPILDFSIMDLGRGAEGTTAQEFSSGQARIITASGAWQDGSIRSVRSGVGLEELGTIGQLPLVTDLWALNSSGSDEYHDTIVATFVDETRIFKFGSDEAVEEVESFYNLDLTKATLLVSNLPDHKLLQVHESGVLIADIESGMTVSQWKPSDGATKVTSAAANNVHLLVVEGGHTLHIFHLSNDSNLVPTTSKTFPHDSQISSLTLPSSRSSSCIVAFWQSASIAILDLHSLESVHTQSVGTPGTAIPRSILVADVLADALPSLFIAMADGMVVTFSFDPSKNTLLNMSRIVLGSEPVFFKLLPRPPQTEADLGKNLSNIFASCEQPSLIYASEGRIVYSAVNSEKASRVCYFNSEAYPEAIAIASADELKLAVIGSERTTQLQTLPIGETVRCITYMQDQKMFGMGCIRRILESGAEALLSSVKIADEVTFKELDSVELRDGELVECIVETGNFERDGQDCGKLFVVGTSLLQESTDGDDIVKGRIIVYQVTHDQKIKLVTEISVKGACRSLAMCDGKIVAGLVKTVVIYGVRPPQGRHSSRTTLELTKLATYRTSTNPLSLSVFPATASEPATIAVADLMKSLSILTLNQPGSTIPSTSTSANANRSESWALTESARHFATVWSSAVTTLNANEWLLADMEGNLVVLRRNVAGVTADDRKRLEVIGEARLGEVVNTIVPIVRPSSVSSQPRRRSEHATKPNDAAVPIVTPQAFLATVEGGVYMFGTISPENQDVLMRLQTALASKVQAPGYMPFAKWRAFRSEVRDAEEPYRFVDGELIESVLRLDEAVLAQIVDESGLEDMGYGVERVRGLAESLRRLY